MSDQPAARGAAPRWAGARVALYFLLGLAALDAVVAAHSRLWRDYDPDPYRERLEECSGQPWDLVVVGASPVMCGVDPAALSGVRWHGQALDRVYNLGLPLATSSEVRLAVEHGLPTPPPRLLVYGVSATDYNEDRVEPRGPRRLMTLTDALRWSGRRPAAALWCARHFSEQHLDELWGLYFYRNGIRLWAADQAERAWPGACPEAAAEARAALAGSALRRAQHGFQTMAGLPNTRLDCFKAAGKIDSSFPFMDHYRLGGSFSNLDRLLDEARRRGFPVMLVDMPVPADLDGRLYPREFASYRAALASAAEARGVPLLSATRDAVGLSDADFSDLIHLDHDGAERFSAWLRGRLEAAESAPAGAGGRP